MPIITKEPGERDAPPGMVIDDFEAAFQTVKSWNPTPKGCFTPFFGDHIGSMPQARPRIVKILTPFRSKSGAANGESCDQIRLQ
jgi:hypothetical protein